MQNIILLKIYVIPKCTVKVEIFRVDQKIKTNDMLPTRSLVKYKDIYKYETNINEWRNVYHANTNKKKA